MLGSGETAVLQFSGGKDSTALLYLARPHLDRITVLFADPGATYPHVAEHIRETCARLGARLEVIRPAMDVVAYTALNGLPADIVPIEALPQMVSFLRDPPAQLVQGYMACCSAMIFEPMHQAIKASGTRIVLRGSKKCDARVGVGDRHVEDGIEYRSPLWGWRDTDVMAYLARHGVTLPRHYDAVPDSLDCWLCTGHLKRHGAAKLRWTREHYPDLWPELARRVTALRKAVDGERVLLAEAFEIAETT